MEPQLTPARLLPVPLPPAHGEVLGNYLHRLAAANRVTPPQIAHAIWPHCPQYFTRRTDTARGGWLKALPRLAVMTGTSAETLKRHLPAASRVTPTPNGTREFRQYNLYRCCGPCMRQRNITEPVIAHSPPHLSLCLKHGIWVTGSYHYPVSHLPEVISAQRQSDQLRRRFPDTFATSAAEAHTMIRAWLRSSRQPELRSRWQGRQERISPQVMRFEHVTGLDDLRQRMLIATYPEFVTVLSVIADPSWRSRRLPHGVSVDRKVHNDLINAIYAEVGGRLAVPDLRTCLEAEMLRHDALFRWADPAGRVLLPTIVAE
jgi:hypothetical protein